MNLFHALFEFPTSLKLLYVYAVDNGLRIRIIIYLFVCSLLIKLFLMLDTCTSAALSLTMVLKVFLSFFFFFLRVLMWRLEKDKFYCILQNKSILYYVFTHRGTVHCSFCKKEKHDDKNTFYLHQGCFVQSCWCLVGQALWLKWREYHFFCYVVA